MFLESFVACRCAVTKAQIESQSCWFFSEVLQKGTLSEGSLSQELHDIGVSGYVKVYPTFDGNSNKFP